MCEVVNITVANKALGGQLGRILLDVLQMHGVVVQSACSGRGICHMCRVFVTGTQTPKPTAQELHVLTADELRRGIRLACQVRIVAGLDVTLLPLFPPAAQE